MSHSIVLSNTFCRDEYPRNQGCEFTNQLNLPLDLSHGKWVVNLSEIIYEPYFWVNIRKPYTCLDVAISNFPYMERIRGNILVQDIRVVLTKLITNLDEPLFLKRKLNYFHIPYPHTLQTRQSIHLKCIKLMAMTLVKNQSNG